VKGDLDGNYIVTITRNEAVHGSKVVMNGKEYYIVSDGEIVTGSDNSVSLYLEVAEGESKKASFRTFPGLSSTPECFKEIKKAAMDSEFVNGDAFAMYESDNEYTNSSKSVSNYIGTEDEKARYSISVSNMPEGRSEMFLHINYDGNMADMYRNGELIADNFYTGQEWEIGLKRFTDNSDGGFESEILISPLKEGDKIYLQTWPEMSNGIACKLNDMHLFAQYRIKIS